MRAIAFAALIAAIAIAATLLLGGAGNDYTVRRSSRTRRTTASPGGGTGHYLRQFGPTGPESAAIYPERLKTQPRADLRGAEAPLRAQAMEYLMSPSSDCRNAGGDTKPSDGTPGCWKHGGVEFQGRIRGDFPHIEPADYSGRD